MSLDLFALVREYHGLGNHRTGTEVDHVTVEWLSDVLTAIGLECHTEPVSFERWSAASRLTVDGADVAHLPIYHEWTGRLDTTAVDVQTFDPMSGGFPEVVDAPIASARSTGADAMVLATEHPNGSLVAVNRRLDVDPSGFPGVLVAGRDRQRFGGADVRLEMSAELVPGTTHNLIAHNGAEGDPLILTTPLTGWFGCAGERGTGIAVLVELVERLSDRPLLVVATGGHELDYLGARHWVEHARVSPTAILHLGASLAVEEDAGDGSRTLVPTRLAMTSLSRHHVEPIRSVLARIGLDLAPETERWIGEGDAWSNLGTPLLSLTGSGVDFHTPEDTPERVTSSEALRRVAEAMTDASLALDDTSRRK